MSPFLFNSVLDPLLEELNHHLSVGIHIANTSLSAMAFADDLLLISDSLDGLHTMISKTSQYLNGVNLQLTPGKSQYFSWRPNDTSKGWSYDLPAIQIAGHTVHSKKTDEPIKYLGISFFVKKNPRVQPAKATDLLHLIAKASLKPFQKLNCWRQLVQSAFLLEAESGHLDRVLQTKVKAALHLPHSFPSSYIWTPSKCGGLGPIQLERVALSGHSNALCRLLRMNEPFITALFTATLQSHFERIGKIFDLPAEITGQEDVNAALKRGSTL